MFSVTIGNHHDEDLEPLQGEEDEVSKEMMHSNSNIWQDCLVIFVPAALWYNLFLLVAFVLVEDSNLHLKWLCLNLGLAGCLYWVGTQLLIRLGVRQALIPALIIAFGSGFATCQLATSRLFYARGGNPCTFFPGVYYDDNYNDLNTAAAAQKYYTPEETQECQDWVTITYVSAFVWILLLSPFVVTFWLHHQQDPTSTSEEAKSSEEKMEEEEVASVIIPVV